jgi:peptide/nickel transport system substrate-binding protein
MWFRLIVQAVTLLAAHVLITSALDARPIRWARSQDALTLDPFSQNEGPTHNILHQIYEPLVDRDTRDGRLVPALALSWKVTNDPTIWEFKLRPNVKFHNGNAFSADDVVFSIARALQPTSDLRGTISFIARAEKVDDLTVHIKTRGANAILPATLINIYMMDYKWCAANNTVTVQDYKNKADNFAVRNTNGTGPYRLVSREQDVKTVLHRNEEYWGKDQVTLGVEEISYLTIKSDATRVAALLSGEVDLVQDVPTQDIDRLQKTTGLTVNIGPENRTIFLGMDVGSPELRTSDVTGRNPFSDRRVRQAMNMAVDREAIKRAVMRNQSLPAGIVMPPFVNGYTKELDFIPKVDPLAAMKLLAEAGFPNGFSVTLHCPNDRYINDESICQAVASMLAKIGIRVNLVAQPKGQHFSLILKTPPETEFYMLGWGVPTYDSHYVVSALYQTRSGMNGTFNATRYSNVVVDKMIDSLASLTEETKRNATIAKLWAILQAEAVYIPLHHQTLAYAMKDMWNIPTSPQDRIDMKFFGAVK